jgi:trehalose 6-phosphate phosphatase
MNKRKDVTRPRPPADLLRGASLFLDFDGTLVDIVDDPSEAEVTSELRELLGLLQRRLEGRVAVLTGRSACYVERMLMPLRLSVGGSHGLEIRIDGSDALSVERPASLDEVLPRLRALRDAHPGIVLEEKPLGVAVHYRLAPDAEAACRHAVGEAARVCGLEVQPGKMVLELKAPGGGKGAALRALMADPRFFGTRPVFLGDDLTDEPGFQVARELGGAGILIGEGRLTAALYGLPAVEEALTWLRQATEVLE